MRFLFVLVFLAIVSGCSSVSYMDQMTSLDRAQPHDEYQYEDLPLGMQDDPGITEKVINIDGSRSFYQAYALPPRRGTLILQLRTYLLSGSGQHAGYFYPVIELQDRNKETYEIIKPQLRFTQLSSEGRYAAVPLTLSEKAAYLVIRTEPKLYGQEASYSTKHSGASWSYSVSPFNEVEPAEYLPAGKLELLTPEKGFSQPFERMKGPFWQLGYARSKEVLVEAGDFTPNLSLGAGPELDYGYALPVYGRPSSTIRASLGGSYYQLSDSGTHRQIYAKAELLWVESNQVSSLGFGITSRFAHEYETPDVTYEFESTFGPKLFVEIRGEMGAAIGAHISWLEYEDQFGNETSATQTGFYFTKLY
ncbi:hypothetical protein HF888_08970 [Bermanella marisrubri]|uniref:Lipoprotein n=1 Tax=Bermanella marisrubri TaxID=207949 RepID=Q1N6N2_9GAMM|nr:hypothetical protein [Bermanella marisrubri]EAT13560.1 hypothetical protein RED65_09219 [Oceanobacter sp. RED65] [Bermanella marisrubri]QIZ84354.1 hypothetical protein HF888_08970 [Bermanella marisrubri]